jgi:RNA 2',3'-cyclic 3'-phosphodiesterase
MRLFVAIEISEELRNAVELRIESIRGKLPAASWLKPEALHLTLAFLGEQAEDKVEGIAGALPGAVATHERFAVQSAGAGFFPHHRSPRVGWIALEPPEPFAGLASSVREALEFAGIRFDAKRFVPHLTVCRIRSRWRQADTEAFMQTLGDLDASPFEVREVVLFSSELKQSGAVHTILHRFPLLADAPSR